MAQTHPIRCRCGRFQAEVAVAGHSTHAVCYCHDCQAFAHFLGPPPGMLDALGGTRIVAVAPRKVTFRAGSEQLACMSLSATGTLRWYARCCRTPLGNTPRDPRTSHVGLVHLALGSPADVERSFGPVRMHVHRDGAHGRAPKNRAISFVLAVLGHLRSLAGSRIGGGWRTNPFFDAAGRPRAQVDPVSRAQREELARAAKAG